MTPARDTLLATADQRLAFPYHPSPVLNGSVGNRYVRAKERRMIREQAALFARTQQLRPMAAPITVHVEWQYKRVPPRVDADGLLARCKPIFDGLVDENVLPDDDLKTIGTPTVYVVNGPSNSITVLLLGRDAPRVRAPQGGQGVTYRTIVADPPWAYGDKLRIGTGPAMRGADAHYLTMPLEWIRALPVASIAEDNAHLYLWTTNAFMVEAHDVARAWGFKPRTILTWVKTQIGMGHYFRNNTEHVIFAVRGSLPLLRRDVPTAFTAPRHVHSAKPECFIDLVETCSPGPRVEIFSRRHRLGWDVWGLESANTASLEPLA